MNWKYHNPVNIIFGRNAFKELNRTIHNRKICIFCTPGGKSRGWLQTIQEMFPGEIVAIYDEVTPNPTIKNVESAAQTIRATNFDTIVAIGGGSVIDLAKAANIAAHLQPNTNFLEILRKPHLLAPEKALPRIIAIPTTAGTGSDLTQWGSVWDTDNLKKYSICHPKLYPEYAIIDPHLTESLPLHETIVTALDALSHAIESLWNKNRNLISDHHATRAIELIGENLPQVTTQLDNPDLREALMAGCMHSALAFSNTRTALAHAISYPMTLHFGIEHGIACSLPLPYIMDYLEKRAAIPKAILSVNKWISAKSLKNLFNTLHIPCNLNGHSIAQEDAQKIIDNCIHPGRSDNFILDLNTNEAAQIIQSMWN